MTDSAQTSVDINHDEAVLASSREAACWSAVDYADAQPRWLESLDAYRRNCQGNTTPSDPTSLVEAESGPAESQLIWCQRGEAAVRCSGKDRAPQPHAEHYACATKVVHPRRDGDQHSMTKMEKTTPYLWLSRQIHLAEPPLFLTETHSATPSQSSIGIISDTACMRCSLRDSRYRMLTRNTSSVMMLSSVLQMPRNAFVLISCSTRPVITCESKSRIVVLRFMRPEDRDVWERFRLALGTDVVELQATDSLTTDVPRIGLDRSARKLLYHVVVRGPSSLRHQDIRAIVAAVAKFQVLDVESVESVGLVDFLPHLLEDHLGSDYLPRSIGARASDQRSVRR